MQYYSTDCTTNTQRLYVCIVCNTIAQIAQSTQKTLQNFRTNPATNTERLCIVCNTIAQIAQSTWKAPTIPWHRLHYQHGKTLQYRSTDCATNTERPCNTATQLAQPTQKGPAIPQHRLRNQHGKALQFLRIYIGGKQAPSNWGQDIGYRSQGSSALLFLLLLNMEICCGKWGKRQYGV